MRSALWRMECPFCGGAQACSVFQDSQQRLYSVCARGCGKAFAEAGLVRFAFRRGRAAGIKPAQWDAQTIASFLEEHPASGG